MFSGVGLVVTWQREVAGRIALRFGQAAVFAAAVLQDVSSRVHPVFCSPAAEVTSIHFALEETERLPSHRRINTKTHHHPGTGTLLRPLWLWPGVRGEERRRTACLETCCRVVEVSDGRPAGGGLAYICGGGAAGQHGVRLRVRHLRQFLFVLLLDGRGRGPQGAGGRDKA